MVERVYGVEGVWWRGISAVLKTTVNQEGKKRSLAVEKTF